MCGAVCVRAYEATRVCWMHLNRGDRFLSAPSLRSPLWSADRERTDAHNNRLCSSLRLNLISPQPRCRPAPTVPLSINWISPTHHRGRAAVVFHFLCLHGARIVSPDLCFWTAGCGCVMPRWVLDGSWCYLCVYFFLLPLVVCHRTDALIRYLRYVSDIGLFMVGILFHPL